jgi:acetyl-CoA carboxylase carboxyltransferase component
MLANQTDTPLLFLQNTTGYMVGADYEQAGIIKDGAKMINAVANSTVPHLTVYIGASYGAGNYGMCGRSYNPRFLFMWPNARVAVMGPEQLAGVMSIVARQSAESAGVAFDDDADAARRRQIEEQIERESHPFVMTGKLYDDGIIDPRDTRVVLGLALSAIHSNTIEGRRGYGVFRM